VVRAAEGRDEPVDLPVAEQVLREGQEGDGAADHRDGRQEALDLVGPAVDVDHRDEDHDGAEEQPKVMPRRERVEGQGHGPQLLGGVRQVAQELALHRCGVGRDGSSDAGGQRDELEHGQEREQPDGDIGPRPDQMDVAPARELEGQADGDGSREGHHDQLAPGLDGPEGERHEGQQRDQEPLDDGVEAAGGRVGADGLR